MGSLLGRNAMTSYAKGGEVKKMAAGGGLGQLESGMGNWAPGGINPGKGTSLETVGGWTGSAGGVGGAGIGNLNMAPIQQVTTPGQTAASTGAATGALSGAAGTLKALGQGGTNTGVAPVNNLNTTYGQGQNLYGQATGALPASAPGFVQQQQAAGAQGTLTGQLGNAGGVGLQTGAGSLQQNANAGMVDANGNPIGFTNQQNAVGALGDIYKQQGTLSGQYGNIAAGQGPNPAQTMLNRATGQNVANQAALMAGQRGAGANVGLMARQAAQQGAATQQGAVGQAASMQAQQQIAAMQAQAQQQQAMTGTQQAIGGIGAGQVGQFQQGVGQQAGIGAGLTGQQQGAINAQFGQGATGVSQATGLLGQNAGIAQNQAGLLLTGQGQVIQGTQGEQGLNYGAVGAANTAGVGMQSNINTGVAGLSQTQMQGGQTLLGGGMNAAGAAAGIVGELMAKGGEVQKMAVGGTPTPMNPLPSMGLTQPQYSGQSSFGEYLFNQNNPGAEAVKKGGTALGKGINKYMNSPDGADVDAMGTTGTGEGAGNLMQGIGSPNNASFATTGAGSLTSGFEKGGEARLADKGGKVEAKKPSEKAVKAGNSYSNDKIDAKLSEHEIVLPRTVTMSNDPVGAAARFVEAVMAQKKRGKK